MDSETKPVVGSDYQARASVPKLVWVRPEVVELPRLTDLTLQTGSPIPGIGDPGSGSTVF